MIIYLIEGLLGSWAHTYTKKQDVIKKGTFWLGLCQCEPFSETGCNGLGQKMPSSDDEESKKMSQQNG